jgi:hypothetical protein
MAAEEKINVPALAEPCPSWPAHHCAAEPRRSREPPSGASDEPSDSTIELAAAVDFKRRGIETKLVLSGLMQQNQGARGNPALHPASRW